MYRLRVFLDRLHYYADLDHSGLYEEGEKLLALRPSGLQKKILSTGITLIHCNI